MKSTIVMATKNKHKVKEIKKILRGSGIKIKTLDAFPEMADIVENGKTLEENALKKAETISKHLKLPALADDSGLFVPWLDGKPGVKSARYAGPACDYQKNNAKLLKAMKLAEVRNRRAYFSTCMALAMPGKKSITAIGKVWGKITTELLGTNGFGYDPIFIPKGMNVSFAQMSAQAKNKISHRALALNKIAQVIKSKLS